jgi:hypothetical protein
VTQEDHPGSRSDVEWGSDVLSGISTHSPDGTEGESALCVGAESLSTSLGCGRSVSIRRRASPELTEAPSAVISIEKPTVRSGAGRSRGCVQCPVRLRDRESNLVTREGWCKRQERSPQSPSPNGRDLKRGLDDEPTCPAFGHAGFPCWWSPPAGCDPKVEPRHDADESSDQLLAARRGPPALEWPVA